MNEKEKDIVQIQMQKLKVIRKILESGTYDTGTLLNIVEDIQDTLRGTGFIYSLPFIFDKQLEHVEAYYNRGKQYKNMVLATLEDLKLALLDKQFSSVYTLNLIDKLLETNFFMIPMQGLIDKWQIGNVRRVVEKQYTEIVV
ncbi:hypothetical protein [Saccharococcus sp. Marseille-Q5394]|uniref:hypothetical protein n=1 Tax=Saccharococcus sp. Marseille-Q5394 TaxID=2972778 RepID=UPI0021C84534|nr:hypothetical protein [Saccharococcus sp. Marseille-Q5394]